jgi:hypothetical protein
MLLLVASLGVAAFLVGFRLSGVVPAASRALGTARAAYAVMRSPALHDDDKESELRRAGVSLLGSAVSILARSLAAFLAALVPILLADLTGLADRDTTVAFLARWDVIIVTSTVMIAIWLIASRL